MNQYPFKRDVCACPNCQLNCQFMPGMLAPSDIAVIAARLGYTDLTSFALENLLASPGAKLLSVNQRTGQAEVTEVRTLVPARKPDGSCKFLSETNACLIHDIAPAGCRYFSAEQAPAESDRRSLAILADIQKEHAKIGLYSRLWSVLQVSGKRAPSPMIARARMRAETVRRENTHAHQQ